MFNVYPMLNAFYISLTRYNLLRPPVFVGFETYRDLFSDPFFTNTVRATVQFVLGFTIPLWIISLLLALLLCNWRWFANAFAMILYSPMVISAVVASMVWSLLYHPLGVINVAMDRLTGQTYLWLSDQKYAGWAIVVMALWKYTGYYVILWLSGLKNIPEEFYEAARIDGANAWHRFWLITLPLLRPTMAFIFVISTIAAFKSFEFQYVMTDGGPNQATNVISLAIYKAGLTHLQMGTAAAMSVLMFLVIMALTLLQLRLVQADRTSYE